MQVPFSPTSGDIKAKSLNRYVAEMLESSDAVAMKLDDFAERAGQAVPTGKRHYAVLRTQTALQQTESALAQTAQSLRRTAGVITTTNR